MKMESAAVLAQPAPGAAPQAVYRQLGMLARQLHDALEGLGVMPQLEQAAKGLPDARSRLNYVALKTGEAAEKVLNSVDSAKAEQARIGNETRRIAQAVLADPVRAVASGALMCFVGEIEAATARVDHHLTDIMLAQDFHDLTGQVVAKVIALAGELEATLLKLLLESAPAELPPRADAAGLHGPVVDPGGRTDTVSSQGEVDDLLASLGF